MFLIVVATLFRDSGFLGAAYLTFKLKTEFR